MPTRTRAEAFDEWMRRYIENPEGYEREFQTVSRFLEEQAPGRTTDYGNACDAYLALLEAGKEVEDLHANPPVPGRELR